MKLYKKAAIGRETKSGPFSTKYRMENTLHLVIIMNLKVYNVLNLFTAKPFQFFAFIRNYLY